jgi:hypothetical protein
VIYGRPWETEEQWRVDWGARGLAEVEDVEFRPMPVRCSVAELLEVLARAESLVEGRALGFSMLTPRRTANTPCHLYVLHEKQWRVGLFDVVVSPGPEVRVTPRYSFPIGKAPGLARILALREALVRAGLPPETDVGDVGVDEVMDGEEPTYAYVIGKERPARWQIDAVTGAVIRRP